MNIKQIKENYQYKYNFIDLSKSGEINGYIYNINDSDSVNSIKEELKKYTDRLKEITDEEFK